MTEGAGSATGEVLREDETCLNHGPSPVVWDDPDEGKQFVAVAADESVVVYSLEAD